MTDTPLKAIRDALERLERANDALCAKRSQRTYDNMLEDGCQDELLELDNARWRARAALALIDSVNPDECRNCNGGGWVCENHEDRPWDGTDSSPLACGCGAGAPCPVCRREMAFAPYIEKERAALRAIGGEG